MPTKNYVTRVTYYVTYKSRIACHIPCITLQWLCTHQNSAVALHASITFTPACFACISNTGTDHFIIRTLDFTIVVLPTICLHAQSPCTNPHSLQALLHSKTKLTGLASALYLASLYLPTSSWMSACGNTSMQKALRTFMDLLYVMPVKSNPSRLLLENEIQEDQTHQHPP